MIIDPLKTKARQIEELVSRAYVKNPIWNYVWYFTGLPLILALSSFITWGDIIIPLKAVAMVILVCILYIGVWVNSYQSDNYLSYRTIGMSVFYTTVGVLAIFAILALTRLFYSRTFLLSAYGLSVIWIILATLLFGKRHRQYIVVEGGLADRLKKFSKLGWKFLNRNKIKNNLADADGIVVDLHVHDDKKMLKALADSSLHGMPVLHAATVLENYTGRVNLDYLAREGLYDLEKKKAYRLLKRVWEVGLIILSLPVTIPSVIIVAIAIKLDSKGSVLFTQKRVGKDDKLFTLYKFRSMRTVTEENGSRFANEKDARITRVGRFIRKFRIDELPQFWNVLKGDMNLIGPRPEQEDFVNYFNDEIPFYSYRHKVRPGITGWAQVKDGYAAGLAATKRKFEYDLYYVKNLSLSLDLLIAYATLKTVLTGFGSR
jgi:lipopolysaccharide/colanic/teichoic acid biosynthesis glycosyltransferase